MQINLGPNISEEDFGEGPFYPIFPMMRTTSIRPLDSQMHKFLW